MLSAAQTRLQKVFIVFVVGFIGTFYAIRRQGLYPDDSISYWKADVVIPLGTGPFAGGLAYGYSLFFPPPDPFAQIMLAAPPLVLSAFSLYLTKIVVTIRLGSDEVSLDRTVRAKWYTTLGIVLLVGVGTTYSSRRRQATTRLGN
jgi:Sec-independent protein secretion pathway component TatC